MKTSKLKQGYDNIVNSINLCYFCEDAEVNVYSADETIALNSYIVKDKTGVKELCGNCFEYVKQFVRERD